MFDWARGSVLKQMIKHHVPFASYEPWLKGWAYGWICALLEVPPGSRVLDVGCGKDPYFAQYFVKQGCEAHGMDAKYDPSSIKAGWGITQETIKNNPNISFHLGLAGQEIGPAGYFDLVTCVSTIEHIYDHDNVFEADRLMPHLDALFDMARMLKPGGVLAMTYDFFLDDMPHWRGWDFLADIRILDLAGLSLLSKERVLRSRTYVFNCEDTLFMAPEGILSFADVYLRSTSIGLIFRKAGLDNPVHLSRRAELESVLFPAHESTTPLVLPPTEWTPESPVRGQLVKDTRTVDLLQVALSRVRQRIRREIKRR